MNKIAVLATFFLSQNLFALPTLNDLSISNMTSYNLSFSVNGRCNKDFGTVRGFTIKTIPKILFAKACKNSPICEVMAYTEKKCSGREIGGIKYDMSRNYYEVFSRGFEHIVISGSAFNIFFSQEFNHK